MTGDVPSRGIAALVPAPVSLTVLRGSVTLAPGLRIEAPGELAAVARWFRRVLEQATAWPVEITGPGRVAEPAGTGHPASGVVRLVLGAPRANRTGRASRATRASGAYRLRIGGGAVTVTSAVPAGVFYGLQTLRQLLPDSWWRAAPSGACGQVEVSGVEIFDEPAFSWRGVHLDVSRHFMPKSFLLKLIDLIAMHKCNVLHLHLTDDQGWRMPVAAYPRLVEIGAWRRESPAGHFLDQRSDGRPHGGYYSTEDLREIVAYASERFVDVLPEIDMPGHMVAAIAAYPELGNSTEQREVFAQWGVSEHVLNLAPATLRFCTDVLDETIGIFPWRFVHVGGDECPTAEWETSGRALSLMAEEGYESVRQLQGWFTSNMARHLSERGRVLVGWDEILDGGAPPGAVVMSWRGEEGGVAAARAGHDVIMAPQQWLYFDWAYSDDVREPVAICPAISVERVWSYDPVPGSIPAEKAHHVLGAQCQLWTEYVATPEHAEYMYFPRVCAFAEMVWRGPALRDGAPRDGDGSRSFAEFEERLGRHLGRLDALGVNYRPLDGPTPGQSRIWSEP